MKSGSSIFTTILLLSLCKHVHADQPQTIPTGKLTSAAEYGQMTRDEFRALEEKARTPPSPNPNKITPEYAMHFAYYAKASTLIYNIVEDSKESGDTKDILRRLKDYAQDGIHKGTCSAPRELDCFLGDHVKYIRSVQSSEPSKTAESIVQKYVDSLISQKEFNLNSEAYKDLMKVLSPYPYKKEENGADLSKEDCSQIFSSSFSAATASPSEHVKIIQVEISKYMERAAWLGIRSSEIERTINSLLRNYLVECAT
jgi:hypothetical protein